MVINGMSLLSLFTLTQRVLPQGVKFPYKLHSKLKPKKPQNLKRLVSATETKNLRNFKTASCASCAFLRSPDDIFKLFDLFDAGFWVENAKDFGLPRWFSLFSMDVGNSMLVCVTLMCFYIGTAQLKKVHG